MSNMILGIIMLATNVLAGVYKGLSWFTVIAVAAAALFVGYGLYKYLQEKTS